MKKLLTSCALILAFTAPLAIAGGDIEAGKAKAAACGGCHGADGISPTGAFPNIGGQYANYLERSLLRYKSGERKNPLMNGMAAPLTEDDIENISAYYASLPGALRDGTLKP